MVRLLSALVLIPVVVGAIWLLPPLGLLAVVQVVLWLAFFEYARLAEALQVRMPTVVAGCAAAATCVVVSLPGAALEPVLIATLVVLAALAIAAGRVGTDVLAGVGAALFGAVYIGLPLGALVAVRTLGGREALLLLLATVIVSDSAQFYAGSLLGRRRLAPAISPKKSVEGAIGGFVGGGLALVVVGNWWLPAVSPLARLGLGFVVVATGILGDLFESQMKRTAGVKDSSALIPGHGGVLDRIDALLFAAPAYYLFLRYGL
ncbi:MAG: phosphatidate cytidylyltransferase [Bacteroidales bacterium]